MVEWLSEEEEGNSLGIKGVALHIILLLNIKRSYPALPAMQRLNYCDRLRDTKSAAV